MMRTRYTNIWIGGALAAGLMGLATIAHAVDDTARFYGIWKASIPYNGQTITIVSMHDANGYKNYVVTPAGNQPAGDGTFSAANGKWTTSANAPNNAGTYHFLDANNVSCTNAAGQTVVWRRDKSVQPAPRPSPGPDEPPPSQPSPPAPPGR